MPIAATSQSVAAVVSPRTERPCRMIAPAPRKPIPLTICAAMRVGSVRTSEPPLTRNSWNPYADTSVKSAEPTQTTRWVRRPAWRSRSSRSMPIAPPSAAATERRSSTCGHSSDGMAARRLWKGNGHRLGLHLGDAEDPGLREREQVVERLARERVLLRRRLHLDETPVARHDHVHVGVGARVLGVVEVEQGHAVDDADRDRGDRVGERAREAEPVERALRRDPRAADRRAARAAVGLEHVAVEPERPLPERAEVDHRAQRTPDQALDLDRAA